MPEFTSTGDCQSPLGEPPQPGQRSGASAGKSREKARRGRPRQDDYIKQVVAILRADLFELENCSTFTQLPGVRAQARLHGRKLLPFGLALRLLLDQAVDETQSMAFSSGTLLAQRLGVFLRLWYEEGGTVVRAAKEMGLSRSYVVHHIQARALELVARRFLELAGRVDAAA